MSTPGAPAVPEVPVPASPPQAPGQDAPDREGKGREAAGYRLKLREAEAERDDLAARLDRLRRAEVERAAAERLAAPEDLWTVGVELDGLLAEDGTLDAVLVDAAIEQVVTERPHWRARHPGFDGGVRQSIAPPGPTFHDVLRGRK